MRQHGDFFSPKYQNKENVSDVILPNQQRKMPWTFQAQKRCIHTPYEERRDFPTLKVTPGISKRGQEGVVNKFHQRMKVINDLLGTKSQSKLGFQQKPRHVLSATFRKSEKGLQCTLREFQSGSATSGTKSITRFGHYKATEDKDQWCKS